MQFCEGSFLMKRDGSRIRAAFSDRAALSHQEPHMLSRREFNRRAAAGVLGMSGLALAGCEQRVEVAPDKSDASAANKSGSARGVTIGMIAKSQSNPVFLAAR